MGIFIDPVLPEDREPLMDIFNYYVENSFAAYPEHKLPAQAFELFLQMTKGFPFLGVRDSDGGLIGFGMLRAHDPMPVFSRTAEISYFIHPDHTGKGIGGLLLKRLEEDAVKSGIRTIMAGISSLNHGSIRFHEKNGFSHCGRFRGIGIKNGQVFDVVWMQKMLQT